MPPHPAADAQPPPPLEMASGNSIYAQRNVLFGMPAPPQGSRFRNRASYNVPLTSLHHAVFLIQEESAAPVSDLLRLNLTDDEIRELLDQVDAPSPQAPASDLQASRSKWNSRHASAVWESRAAGVARLRTKMDEQRAVYATVLRDYDHRDVEVIYSDTLYEHDRLRADFDAIRQKGGRIYHMYPWVEADREMKFSMIISADHLAHLYPDSRNIVQNIRIRVNTAPAPNARSTSRSCESQATAGTSTVPYSGLRSPSPRVKGLENETFNQINKCSGSLQENIIHETLIRLGQTTMPGSGNFPATSYTRFEAPAAMLKDPLDWWQADFDKREKQLQPFIKWDYQTRHGDDNHFSEAYRSLAKQISVHTAKQYPVKQYPGLATLSNGYAPTEKWIQQNFATGEMVEYQDAMLRMWHSIAKALVATETIRWYGKDKTIHEMYQAMANRAPIIGALNNSRALVVHCAQKCGLTPAVELLDAGDEAVRELQRAGGIQPDDPDPVVSESPMETSESPMEFKRIILATQGASSFESAVFSSTSSPSDDPGLMMPQYSSIKAIVAAAAEKYQRSAPVIVASPAFDRYLTAASEPITVRHAPTDALSPYQSPSVTILPKAESHHEVVDSKVDQPGVPTSYFERAMVGRRRLGPAFTSSTAISEKADPLTAQTSMNDCRSFVKSTIRPRVNTNSSLSSMMKIKGHAEDLRTELEGWKTKCAVQIGDDSDDDHENAVDSW